MVKVKVKKLAELVRNEKKSSAIFQLRLVYNKTLVNCYHD